MKKIVILGFVALFIVFTVLAGKMFSLYQNVKQMDKSSAAGVPQEKPQVVEVKADQGVLTPNDIQVAHLKPSVIYITAVDRDYIFQSPALKINQSIKKGTTVSINVLTTAGVGKYLYQCGSNCSGNIELYDLDDEDE